MATDIQSFITVANMPDSSRDRCPTGTWLEWWENRTGFNKMGCCARDCHKPATDGSHVQKIHDPSKTVYIIPLCHECNMRSDTFDVYKSALVNRH